MEDLLGASRDHAHAQEPGKTAAVVDGSHVHDDGDMPVSVGVWCHTCSSTPIMRTIVT